MGSSHSVQLIKDLVKGKITYSSLSATKQSDIIFNTQLLKTAPAFYKNIPWVMLNNVIVSEIDNNSYNKKIVNIYLKKYRQESIIHSIFKQPNISSETCIITMLNNMPECAGKRFLHMLLFISSPENHIAQKYFQNIEESYMYYNLAINANIATLQHIPKDVFFTKSFLVLVELQMLKDGTVIKYLPDYVFSEPEFFIRFKKYAVIVDEMTQFLTQFISQELCNKITNAGYKFTAYFSEDQKHITKINYRAKAYVTPEHTFVINILKLMREQMFQKRHNRLFMSCYDCSLYFVYFLN